MKRQYITPQTMLLRISTEQFITASNPQDDELDITEDETEVMETKDYSFNLWEDDTKENEEW